MFLYQTSIRLQHTDAAGVMYFAAAFNLAHDAFEAFMDQHLPLVSIIRQGDHIVPIVHAEVDFLAPLTLGDRIEIQITLAHRGDSSFKLAYVFQTQDGRPCAKLATTHTVVGRADGQSAPIFDDLARALSHLE
ncbi:MAG: acyl-CoA thioesterase [Phycisphaeraceae bacterium]|nr:acyl-CoA thioesterase [Phycisphaeraceae bacterium]